MMRMTFATVHGSHGGRRALMVACPAIAMSMAMGTAALAGQIRIWPTAAVERTDVRLGDVASITGFDLETTQSLAALTLEPSGQPGATIAIRSLDVRRVLDTARVNWNEISLLGSSTCDVLIREAAVSAALPGRDAFDRDRHAVDKGGDHRIRDAGLSPRAARRTELVADGSGVFRPVAFREPMARDSQPEATRDRANETLQDALDAYIEGFVGDLGGRVEVRYSRAHRGALAFSRPAYDFSITPRRIGGAEGRLGMHWFDVHVRKTDAAVASNGPDGSGAPNASDHEGHVVPVLADISLLKPVVVVSQIVNRGQEITSRDIRLEARSFTSTDDIGMTDPASVIGMEARRALRPSDMLKATDVQRKALVRRNQLVTILSRAGSITAQSAGRAATDGWYGDRIVVRIEGTQERLHAIVTGPGTVSVQDLLGDPLARR